MTLSDIETTLGELAVRHENLDAQLLETLLRAAGWEDKVIKEALMLFKTFDIKKWKLRHPTPIFVETKTSNSLDVNRNADVPNISSSETATVADTTKDSLQQAGVQDGAIVFYQQDGTEERNLRMLTQEQMSSPVKRVQNTALVTHVQVLPQDHQEYTAPVENNNVIPEIASVKKEDMNMDGSSERDNENRSEASQKSNTREVSETHSEIQTHIIIKIEESQPKEITQAVFQNDPEPESLVVTQESDSKKEIQKEIAIPDNLPLLPFESSPHVWSFSRYKNVFHSGDKKPESDPVEEEIKVISVMPQSIVEVVHPVVKPVVKEVIIIQEPVETKENEEASLEKVPMTKGDESLVFLAGVMLLVIILILGYMYSNGRL